ncbi:MAG: phosphotransferase [Myxococcaceae bacterium]|nr:phosphotransferase [Myxococcaceae bacterium]
MRDARLAGEVDERVVQVRLTVRGVGRRREALQQRGDEVAHDGRDDEVRERRADGGAARRLQHLAAAASIACEHCAVETRVRRTRLPATAPASTRTPARASRASVSARPPPLRATGAAAPSRARRATRPGPRAGRRGERASPTTKRAERSVLHGDARVGNMLFPTVPRGRFVLFDWQAVRTGRAEFDVAYFLMLSSQGSGRVFFMPSLKVGTCRMTPRRARAREPSTRRLRRSVSCTSLSGTDGGSGQPYSAQIHSTTSRCGAGSRSATTNVSPRTWALAKSSAARSSA